MMPELTLRYENAKGETGVLFGVNVRPLVEGKWKRAKNGLAFTLIPENPIIAFRKFHFVDHHNWIYLHKKRRLYANVDMADDEDMGFRIKSNRSDTVSLQNIVDNSNASACLRSVKCFLICLTCPGSSRLRLITCRQLLPCKYRLANIDELTYERQTHRRR
ncbi:MAG: hypothetical protein V8Q21_13070, partial [Akkermansia muciniphila]